MLCGCLSLLYISVMAVSDASVMSALARCLSPVIALVWSQGGGVQMLPEVGSGRRVCVSSVICLEFVIFEIFSFLCSHSMTG